MRPISFRTFLLAVVAAAGMVGLASSASALIAVGPNPADFQITESCSTIPCSGTFTVVNNSAGDGNWYVYGFQVGNPRPFSDGTTQTNWNAVIGCIGVSCEGRNAFVYSNDDGSSDTPTDLANDVGPGQTSDLFTFMTEVPGSPVDILLVNSIGGTNSISVTAADQIPEPASLALFGMGLAGLAAMRRKRKAN